MSIRPIILAEDNDQLRRMYTEMLEAAGFTVIKVSNGEKAIGMLHKISHPQLIILDVMMPRMDGIETCLLIRKMQGLRPSPVLFLSALDNPDTILECLRAGGDDYLVKTAPMAEVLERVRFWARKGCSDEGSERRKAAIKELEALTGESASYDTLPSAEGLAPEQAALNWLAYFISAQGDVLNAAESTVYRFGYVVGLVNACMENRFQSERHLNRFLRNLLYRTDIIDRQEVDAIFDNFARIATQSQFQSGWTCGQNDAPQAQASDAGKAGGEAPEEKQRSP